MDGGRLRAPRIEFRAGRGKIWACCRKNVRNKKTERDEVEILTAAAMQRHEKSAMAAGLATGQGLMETAGRGVLAAALDTFPWLGARPGRALVLCGPGNNGGDGYVIARLLRARGWSVRLFAFGDTARLPPDAAANAARWREMGDIEPWAPEAIGALPTPDLVVDAVFGLGLKRPPPEEVAAVLGYGEDPPWEGSPAWVAVDCPTGLDLDTGRMLGTPPRGRADLTVTFHCPKPGHLLGEGPARCGALRLVDLGLAPAAAPDAVLAGGLEARGADEWARALLPKLGGQGHKYDYGHAMVLCGGPGQGGAGRLAARAALRVGAGLVTVLCPPSALAENAGALDAVMLRTLEGPADLAEAVDRRVRALCLGPGLGRGDETRETVLAALRLRRRTVLDADALTVFEAAPEDLFAALHEECLLTPHAGEFARLFPDLAEGAATGAAPLETVRQAAARAGAVVLLKGPATLIAAPDGAVRLHAACYERAVPWLATAGAGDVLAGLAAGLAAASPETGLAELAGLAAWLHVEAARRAGPGLIAEDLPEALPAVLRGLGG